MNAAREIPNFYPKDFVYQSKDFSFDDALYEDLFKRFEECWDVINKARSLEVATFVHCRAGISRSASLVISYLMYEYDQTFPQALAFVQNKRPQVMPNESFCSQLEYLDFILKQWKEQNKQKVISPVPPPPMSRWKKY